jgi:hypothetical protein
MQILGASATIAGAAAYASAILRASTPEDKVSQTHGLLLTPKFAVSKPSSRRPKLSKICVTKSSETAPSALQARRLVTQAASLEGRQEALLVWRAWAFRRRSMHWKRSGN